MNNKKIVAGVIVLILIGAALVYYARYRVGEKLAADPSRKESSTSDSTTGPGHEKAPSEMGARPEKNPEDGSIKIVEDFIKSNTKNPATIEFLEWSELSIEDGYWKVQCKYRGVSSFNAEVTTSAWFYMKNNKVVHTKIISKI
jgi:hypothetical protein